MDPSLRHLLARLELLQVAVRAAVNLRQELDPDPDDLFRGLHISDEHARRLLDQRPRLADVAPDLREIAEAIELDAEQAAASGHHIRLRSLAEHACLDGLDVGLLLVALAPDLDPRLEQAYGYLHDDLTRRRSSIGLAMGLCGASANDADARARLGAAGPLVRHHLVDVEELDRPFLTRSLRVPDAVTAFLLGSDDVDPELAPHLATTMGDSPADAAPLERALAAGVNLVHVKDRPGGGAVSWTATALRRVGRPPVIIDLERVAASDDAEGVVAAARRRAVLTGGVVVAGPVRSLVDGSASAVRLLADTGVAVILVDSGPWDPSWSERVPLILVVPDDARAGAPTATFRLTPDQWRRAEIAADLLAIAEGSQTDPTHLAAGARAQNTAGLERLAVRVEPRAGWEDLVVPDDLVEQLRALSWRVRDRDRVMVEWGMDRGATKGRGVTALFAGASGTGKTLAAEVIAHDLELDLYVIDLATVVDKYIGETEKNLDRIFAEADRVNGVLLFDEADAIFGKRSEVQDARDRHANVEVAYLLQRMERFEGVALLTTNLRANIDEAFLRRLDVLVDFPTPDTRLRRALWDRHLPPTLPRDGSVDTEFLAAAFDLTGGNISSIATTAAFLAAANGGTVTMETLVRATAREYRKLGRMCSAGEFGEWLDIVTERPALVR